MLHLMLNVNKIVMQIIIISIVVISILMCISLDARLNLESYVQQMVWTRHHC